MKNIVRTIRIVIIGTVLSCREDTNIQELRNNENILKFESHEDFENTINVISKMTNDELDAWEKNKSFVSFRTHLSNVYKELVLS